MNIKNYIEYNKLKCPETFEDILKLQEILDNNIHNVRERKLDDIKLSLIAEIIELNEETKESHKTWKSKTYDREKELEELTDVYFFFAQMINYINKMSNYSEEQVQYEIIFYKKEFEQLCDSCAFNDYTYLIHIITNNNFKWFFIGLLTRTRKLGYTKEDILNCYWKKWQKNMKRIGK